MYTTSATAAMDPFSSSGSISVSSGVTVTVWGVASINIYKAGCVPPRGDRAPSGAFTHLPLLLRRVWLQMVLCAGSEDCPALTPAAVATLAAAVAAALAAALAAAKPVTAVAHAAAALAAVAEPAASAAQPAATVALAATAVAQPAAAVAQPAVGQPAAAIAFATAAHLRVL